MKPPSPPPVIGIAWFFLLLSGPTSASPVRDADHHRGYRLLVLHTNDMHSYFVQTDQTGAQCPPAADGSRCYGGFARIKTVADRVRAAARLADGGSLFLNAGDTFQGTAFYTYLKWPVVARMIRPLGIDVMVSTFSISPPA